MSNKSPPSCFGDEWEEKHVECRGGLDPLFSDPETGSNKREKCSWYEACAHQKHIGRQQGEQLIPTQQLFRFPPPPGPVQQAQPAQQPPQFQVPQVPVPSYANVIRNVAQQVAAAPQVPVQNPMRPPMQPQAPSVQTFFLPNQQPQQPQPQYYQQPQQAQQYQPPYAQGMVPPYMASMPGMVPMNYVMPGTQMPSFLTVPEPMVYGQHWSRRLAFTLLRGMVKAFGMTLANFFDHTPVTPWQPPQPPAPPPAPPTT